MSLARFMAIGTSGVVFRFFMKVLNTCEVKEDDRYKRFLHALKHRPQGQPLITVANHRSVLDDPSVFAW